MEGIAIKLDFDPQSQEERNENENENDDNNESENQKKLKSYKVFKSVTTEAEAYLLGRIAGVSHLKPFSMDDVAIVFRPDESDLMLKVQRSFSKVEKLTRWRSGNQFFCWFEKHEISNNICNLFQVQKESKTLKFPKLEESLRWHFIRGIFESSGCNVPDVFQLERVFSITIQMESEDIAKEIESKSKCKIHRRNSIISLEFIGVNALDILSNMYDTATLYSEEYKQIYVQLSSPNVLFPTISDVAIAKVAKSLENAIIPKKQNASDIGYDLSIVALEKVVSKKISLYDTGIIIQPQYGWYAEVVARSSFGKSGYILSNGLGIIDPSYTGSIKLLVTKIDKSLPDIVLPCRIAQIIFRQSVHFIIEQVDKEEIIQTERGSGGFGSTGQEKNLSTILNSEKSDKDAILL